MKDNYDLSKLSVTPEPYEAFQRINKPSKYEAVFKKTGEGMRLRCPPEVAAGLSSQLHRWLEKQGHTDFIVRHRSHCKDGMGGIWWMKEKKPAKTTIRAFAPWPEEFKK